MELVKKNIHMDRIKCKAATQITLDDDVNISDSMPDAIAVILDKADVKVEETKATADHVHVKGSMQFAVLYQSEEGTTPVLMTGKIPFEEQLYMEGAEPTDQVTVHIGQEDLNISLINSRKLNIQALLGLQAQVEELYDEETAVELYHEEPVEYRKNGVELSEIAIQKKDIFRIKEELELPQNYPNIFKLLWESVKLGEVECKPLDEKISIQGELEVFALYEGEGEDTPIRYYETTVPFNGIIDCHGCRETMLPDIRYEIGHKEMEVRPDFDGEERILGLDLVLDLDMKLYEEECVAILADVYGVTKEVEAVTRKGCYKDILVCSTGKCKVSDKIKVKANASRVLQLCHSEGNVQIDSAQAVENGILLEGSVGVQVLYITGDDKQPYACLKGHIPFRYTLEAAGIESSSEYNVQAQVEQINSAMLDSEEIEIKAVLCFHAVVFKVMEKDIVTDIVVKDLDIAKVNDLPGIVAYIAKEGDTLWQIGKKYYVPVAQIKEMNNLGSDELRPGDKLLIVK